MVHMRTVNSVATPDRESGMAHQRAYLAAVDGKHPVNKASRLAETFAYSRRLAFAAAAFFAASTARRSRAVGPVRRPCRQLVRRRHHHAGRRLARAHPLPRLLPGLRPQHDHDADLRQRRLQVQPWGQCRRSGRPGHAAPGPSSSRNISGSLQGRGGGGNFQVVASTAGFNANISLRTAGNKQTVTMRADSQFRGADISLSK